MERAAAITRLVFDPIPLGWIVTGSDNDAPAAPRCRTSSEMAGVGQGLSASQTGVPVALRRLRFRQPCDPQIGGDRSRSALPFAPFRREGTNIV